MPVYPYFITFYCYLLSREKFRGFATSIKSSGEPKNVTEPGWFTQMKMLLNELDQEVKACLRKQLEWASSRDVQAHEMSEPLEPKRIRLR